jgi:4'-phosphopantetheinyl transferase
LNGWQTPSKRLSLEPDEAHIWMVRTDAEAIDVDLWLHALGTTERVRAERFRHASGRSGFVIARSALRHLLGRYLDVLPATIELRQTPSGKPELAGQHASDLRFSVAHSGAIALLSFAAVEVGVDVERIRPIARSERIASRVFSDAMRQRLADVSPADRQDAFFAAWTQREALVKAVGGTLLATHDPLEFEWPVPDGPRVFGLPTASPSHHWTVLKLPQPEGYAAAFVAAGDVRRIGLFLHPAEPADSADR